MPSDKILPTFQFDRKFEINIFQREDRLNNTLPNGSVIHDSASARLYYINPKIENNFYSFRVYKQP